MHNALNSSHETYTYILKLALSPDTARSPDTDACESYAAPRQVQCCALRPRNCPLLIDNCGCTTYRADAISFIICAIKLVYVLYWIFYLHDILVGSMNIVIKNFREREDILFYGKLEAFEPIDRLLSQIEIL